MQLYHTTHFGTTNEKPLLVPQTTSIQKSVTNLDRIQPYETHKIGVLYVGPGQVSNEVEILGIAFMFNILLLEKLVINSLSYQ